MTNNPTKIYEDEYIIVFDKPAGIVINRSGTLIGKRTMQDIVESMYPDLFSSITTDNDSDFIKRTGMVHRLDKETSGLVIFALNEKSFIDLQQQFFDREVQKMYSAISYGVLPGAVVGDEIEVDAPIARNPNSRMKYSIGTDGKNAYTKFVVKDIIEGKRGKFTHFECLPKTGRTHQIRVHLTALNTPVVGDKLYSGRTRIRKDVEIFPRHMLHATKISFNHPVNKKLMNLSSKLPKDFTAVLDLLQET